MKKTYKFIYSSLLAMAFFTSLLSAQSLSGDLKFWQKSDFLGFDEIGDCSGTTGDISSVFARTEQNTLLLRVSFDDMVNRLHNVVVSDNFNGKDIQLKIKLTNQISRKIVIDDAVDLSESSFQKRNISTLRTPESNLWEAEILLPQALQRENIEYSLAVVVDGKIVDYFLSDGGPTDAEGNCAFVHHGNQGITYTEVFYGSPGGQSGLDGSGFDEVLQAHEATNVPGNFHMSGTLMPAASWHNPEFNDWLTTLAGDGLIEMMTSALGQHIMPFVHNNMNDWSVDIECDMVNYKYNYQPRTAWIPERVWLSPGNYPDAGVIDWLGDNWAQHGVWGVVLDDSPHLNGYDNRKIHWMNNGSGIDLRVIPINNSFVGNMHYDASGAKNQIAGMGQYNICVYGTDWEVAAEMNEHDGTFFLDNYESVLWWCHDNYPGVNVWKTVDAMQNANFNGAGAEITPGTYGLLGGSDGYGGSDNSWYTQWAATASHSDFHDPSWTYGYIWDDAHNNLLTAPDNNLAQLAWYILMINLHETGWHDGGSVAGWEHRYSSHIKNANVYAEAARWADGQYETPLAAYFNDIDHDGVDELVMHNQDIFAVFESIGGKINWLFYKDGLGGAYSVVGSDMAYWAETDGDYNDGSNNHVAALSDVYPYQQDAIYEIDLIQSSGDVVVAELSQWGVKKRIQLMEGVNYLDVQYDFFGGDGYVKSGFSPGLTDILWSGKDHIQRMWGDYGSYCGQRNSSSGATVALVMGDGGASHNTQFEGTLVLGDEITGNDQFFTRLYAGYTSEPTGTTVPELNTLAAQSMDVFPPTLSPTAFQVDNNTIELTFSEALEFYSAQNKDNYSLDGFTGNYTISNVIRQNDWRKVRLTIMEYWAPGDEGSIIVTGVEDLNGNVIAENNTASFLVPSGTTPHTIAIDGTNDFDPETELMVSDDYSLYLTWDNTNLYIGFEDLDLNGGGDLFVNIDTDQGPNSGASGGSWGRVSFTSQYEIEYQVAIEGGGGSLQLNHFANGIWHYPANNNCESYEGWSGNGLTEISIPWASMGNPDGVALSVHVSEEDSQEITAAYPPQNPTGTHPTFTHVYAFYIPYISSEMPVAGMEPANAVVMPNAAPEITDYQPEDLQQEIPVGESVEFTISASDPENDPIAYTWLLDNEMVSTNANYNVLALAEMTGTHQLIAKVWDEIPGHESDSVVWQIEITQDDVLMAGFSSNHTTICIDGEIDFTDLSSGEITGWLWNFEGGTPESSTDQNPVVTYSMAGSFDVSLTITDGIENNTLSLADYITVNNVPTVNAGEDASSCEGNEIQLEATASNYSTILWTSAGDGVFSNTTSLTSSYTPGPGDVLAGYVEIQISAFPLSPCPQASSDLLMININSAPIITAQPLSQNAPAGTQVIFSVEAQGSEPFNYTWFGPTGEIAGANTHELIIENAQPSDQGYYYCVVGNMCGEETTTTASLTIEALLTQTLNIPNGWSGISSWLVPQNTMVQDIFAEAVQNNDLIVLQNYNYLYWPGQNINTIDLNGGWDYESGYQIKVNGDQQIEISGNSIDDKTLSYENAGWYLLPILNECGVAPEVLFADMLDDLVIVKEIAGTRLYWPGVFQNLFQLEAGKSYVAGFSAPASFSFPECDAAKSAIADLENSEFKISWKNMIPGTRSHIIVLDATATRDFSSGDILSFSSSNDVVFAKVEILTPGEAIAIPIFMDDKTTSAMDGFTPGEELKINWLGHQKIHPENIHFNDDFDALMLKENGMSQIKSLGIDKNMPTESIPGDMDIYPNPGKNILYFNGTSLISSIRIYSSHGNLVFDNQLTKPSIDISKLPQGVYYVYIVDEGIQIVKKFVKQ